MELDGCYLTILATPRPYRVEDKMIDEYEEVGGMRIGTGN
jgi:hypothetical protein